MPAGPPWVLERTGATPRNIALARLLGDTEGCQL